MHVSDREIAPPLAADQRIGAEACGPPERVARAPAWLQLAALLTQTRWFDVLELGLFLLAAGCVVWLVGPQVETHALTAPLVGTLLAGGLLYAAYLSPVLLHGDAAAARGLGSARTAFVRTDNLRAAALAFGSIALVGGALIVAAALARDPRVFAGLDWAAFWKKLLCYAFSATAQDLIYLGWAVPRLTALWPTTEAPGAGEAGQATARANRVRVTAAMALLFMGAHAPNVPLMLIGVPLSIAVVMAWMRAPNLLAAVCCHALLGTLLHRVLQMSTRIGPLYWTPDVYVMRNIFPFVKAFIGNSF